MSSEKCFHASAEDFKKIPGSPIAYWLGEKMIKAFEGDELKMVMPVRQGLATGENNRFVRLWHEVSLRNIEYKCADRKASVEKGNKWFPYNKGGEFRKWYGNQDFIVNWQDDGREIRSFVDDKGKLRSRPQNMETYFLASVSWSKVSGSSPAFRFFPCGFIYDVAGTSIFPGENCRNNVLGFCNSSVALAILQVLSPTLNYEVGHIASLPISRLFDGSVSVESNVAELISLSRSDWDEYETSWDFKVNPLVREGWQRAGAAMSIETAWAAVFARRLEWAERMKTLEEENNRLFIEAYGLQDELSPDVAWKDVSITGNPAYRYKLDGDPQSGEDLARADAMRELISYGMGVLMGRYSLEQEGLILASQGELYKDYIARVHGAGKILPDEDGVIPAITLEGGFFKDNLLHRMREFLSAAFGNDALPQNLNFIEAALGCGFNKYLTEKFFDDHVKTYKKRPIYWLFESPKGYFRAFAYMHRMTGATAGHIRNNYLLPYIGHLEKCFAAEVAKGSAMTSAERKRVKAMEAAIKDCKAYDLVLHDFADQSVAIDLDDGVVVNWKKYESVLAKL